LDPSRFSSDGTDPPRFPAESSAQLLQSIGSEGVLNEAFDYIRRFSRGHRLHWATFQ
jgi:hypothetical protein